MRNGDEVGDATLLSMKSSEFMNFMKFILGRRRTTDTDTDTEDKRTSHWMRKKKPSHIDDRPREQKKNLVLWHLSRSNKRAYQILKLIKIHIDGKRAIKKSFFFLCFFLLPFGSSVKRWLHYRIFITAVFPFLYIFNYLKNKTPIFSDLHSSAKRDRETSGERELGIGVNKKNAEMIRSFVLSVGAFPLPVL